MNKKSLPAYIIFIANILPIVFCFVFMQWGNGKPVFGTLSKLTFSGLLAFLIYSWRNEEEVGRHFLREIFFPLVFLVVAVQTSLDKEWLGLNVDLYKSLQDSSIMWLSELFLPSKIISIIAGITYLVGSFYLAGGIFGRERIKHWFTLTKNLLRNLRIRKAVEWELTKWDIASLCLVSVISTGLVFMSGAALFTYVEALIRSTNVYILTELVLLCLAAVSIIIFCFLHFCITFLCISLYLIREVKDPRKRKILATTGIKLLLLAFVCHVLSTYI